MESSNETGLKTHADAHSKEASSVRPENKPARTTMPPPRSLKNSELLCR